MDYLHQLNAGLHTLPGILEHIHSIGIDITHRKCQNRQTNRVHIPKDYQLISKPILASSEKLHFFSIASNQLLFLNLQGDAFNIDNIQKHQ